MVAFCKQRPGLVKLLAIRFIRCISWFQLRKDKYSNMRDKHHVDFKEIDTKKKTFTEREEHSERTEAPTTGIETAVHPTVSGSSSLRLNLFAPFSEMLSLAGQPACAAERGLEGGAT